jgi:hypothetical protein
LIQAAYNLANVYIYWTVPDAAAAANTGHVLELLWKVEELMIEALPQSLPLRSPGVITPSSEAKARGLAALPAPYSFYLSLIGIVPHIEAIASGTNISTDVTMQAAVTKLLPIRVIEEVPHC